MKFVDHALIVVAALACAGCAGTRVSEKAFAIDEHTTRLSGWLSASGEWILFPTKHLDQYDPYVVEDKRCISLINGTTKDRSEFQGLHGRRVHVTGHSIDYESLQLGKTAADQLLSKRYFEDQVVLNSCLRRWVMVATSVKSD